MSKNSRAYMRDYMRDYRLGMRRGSAGAQSRPNRYPAPSSNFAEAFAVINRIREGNLVQHMDGRQGRVAQVGLLLDNLPAARVKWFRGQEEVVALGYIWTTRLEENWE